MKTLMKSILISTLVVALGFCSSTYAFAEENDNAPIDSSTFNEHSTAIETVKKYLIIDGERVYFDYDKAIQDKVTEEIIDMGLLVEEISEEYSSKTFHPAKYLRSGWEIHGNYCGPWHSGNNFTLPVTDVLDQGCQNHDRCYKWELGLGGNCDCNRQLIDYIKVYRRWMPANVLWKADSIRLYFETVGQVGC